jgi:rhodanese-related sulfurtransferase
MRLINREDLQRALKSEKLTIVEVLPAEYFERAHIPTAINIPADRVSELAPRFLPSKGGLIVTYGLNFTWKMSEQVARELIGMGYTNVAEYQEGKQDWIAAGLPLEGANTDDPLPKGRPSVITDRVTDGQRRVLGQAS